MTPQSQSPTTVSKGAATLPYSDTEILSAIPPDGKVSARDILVAFPALGDTVASTRVLKRLVEQGKLSCTSQPGRNAQFHHTLPEPEPAPVPATVKKTPAARRQSPRGLGTRTERELQELEAFIVASPRGVTKAQALNALSTGPIEPYQLKRLISHLLAAGKIRRVGSTIHMRYQGTAFPTDTASSGNVLPLPMARVLLDCVDVERKIYSELLAAAMVSSDPHVKKLAAAAALLRAATNAIAA